MKRKLTSLLPYVIVLAADFYLLPLLMRDTGAAMLLILCIMPLVAFVTAVMYGLLRGFSLILPAMALVLFVPTIFIHYNPSAWVYAPVYAVIVLAGTGLGRIFYGKK